MKKKTNKKSASQTKKTAAKPLRQVTEKPTESDLEAEIHRALLKAFPWIPATDLTHQTKFSFRMGRATISVDGEKSFRAEGRADIIVHAKSKPHAVLELKRGDKPITQDDADQGVSYARMLTPMPPLVIVTNGKDVRFLATHTGADWKPASVSEAEFAKLVEAASRAASVDIKQAVQVLLGTGNDIWVSAVRQATAMTLEELSGAWDDPLLPFVPDYLIPRKATQQVLALLYRPARAVIVEGAPLSGKSNVLREVALRTVDSKDFAVLFIEADGYGPGCIQRLANMLSPTLAWSVSADEVRAWLRQLSIGDGPALVLAIDGVGPNNEEVRKDIEELCSTAYGKNLRMVIAMDDTVVPTFTLNSTQRKYTPLGRAAKEAAVEVMPLDDHEFGGAMQALWDHRIGFVHGVQAAAEMRSPWVLRTSAADVAEDLKHKNETLTAMLPPMLGLHLIACARHRFKDPDLRRKLREVAKAVLEESGDLARPMDLILESVGVFIVRNKTLKDVLEHSEIKSLVEDGVLKRGTHASGEAVLFVRLPELLASELSLLLAEELVNRLSGGAEGAAEWLTDISKNIPLGDIVAAQAIFDAAGMAFMPLNLINALVAVPPREEDIRAGTKFALHFPGFGVAHLEFQEDGSLIWTAKGQREVIQPEGDEGFGSIIADHSSWLILSHLAMRPFMMESPDGKKTRLDPLLLLEIGTCPYILRGPQNDPKKNAVLMHDVRGHGSIVCHRSGIVEPITMAIYVFLGENGPNATGWIEQAIGGNSFPLLARIDIALQQFVDSSDREKAAWAKRMADEHIKPAMGAFPALH
ncbi:MAG: type I restriction enzyme HsdR N-terminal domain-containing protein [Acidobacteriia bacterium]|nr:type I restriction enzyme HsdR N-terminal domain-containing protein [Terriglobia bacterium]